MSMAMSMVLGMTMMGVGLAVGWVGEGGGG